MVKLNKIYTRTGDGGSAGLVDGNRVSKSSLRMTAIGEVDEANAVIGVAIAVLGGGEIALQLVAIQNELFALGAAVATAGEPSERRLRSTRRSSSTATCSLISIASRTICSSPRAQLPRARAAMCCGN